MTSLDKLKEIIDIFNNGNVSAEETINSIFTITGKSVDENFLRNYWTSMSLEEFCEILLTEPITDWENIDDIEALRLIKEILEKIVNSGILIRNSEALEKRYSKPNGFISDLIFHSDISDEKQILKKLKKNTTIFL